MDFEVRLPIKVTSATSTFMIGVIASAGAYCLRGDIVPDIAGRIAVSTVALAALLGLP